MATPITHSEFSALMTVYVNNGLIGDRRAEGLLAAFAEGRLDPYGSCFCDRLKRKHGRALCDPSPVDAVIQSAIEKQQACCPHSAVDTERRCNACGKAVSIS